MKLVGATNGFIRFPFFVEGVTSGLISALIASAIVCGGYYAVYEWYGKNPTNLTTMFGGTLLPLQDLWYYVVLGFMLFGFVLCGIGTATSIIVMEMKIRESCLQSGTFIYKPGISVTKQDFIYKWGVLGYKWDSRVTIYPTTSLALLKTTLLG